MADNLTLQRDQDIVTYESFAGLRNDVSPERFNTNDLATAINVNLDKSGEISRRPGFTKQVSASVHSLWASRDTCLYASGSTLYRLNPDLATSVGLTSLSSVGSRVSYQQVNDQIFYANGADFGVIDHGVARTWGIVPPVLPGVTVTVGQMPAGTYQFSLTYFRVDGQESGAPLAGVISAQNGAGLSFTLPVSTDPGVVSKALYVSPPNGDTMYLAALIPNSVTNFTYTNDTLELDLPLATQFLQGPPAGHLLGFYRGRMYVAVGDTIYPSQPYAYEQFDLRENFQLDGRVTLMASMTDRERGDTGEHSGFFIGTDRSCGVIVGNDVTDFQYVPKTDYGAIMGAIDYVDGSLFGDNSAGARQLPMFLTTQGICIGLPEMDIRNLTRTKYGFAAGGQGAALFQPGPNRFIATSNF